MASRIAERARSGAALRGYAVFGFALLLLFVADGSRQPTSGEGWRILGYQRGVAGPTDIVRIDTQAELDRVWDRARIRSAPARLTADTTTFWVTATGSIGCPAHFAGLRRDAASIIAVFTSALTVGCDTLKVPDSFLLAVDNDRLPAGPFRFVRVGPAGQPDAAMEVTP